MYPKGAGLTRFTYQKKRVMLHYSENLKKLSEFKEGLIKGMFSSLNSIDSINYIFIVGSFLTEKV